MCYNIRRDGVKSFKVKLNSAESFLPGAEKHRVRILSPYTGVRFRWLDLGCVQFLKKKNTMRKKILRHIKLAIHTWSTKCR
jgi:hypothetical protein